MVGTALVLGAMGSLHCLGMCGPIAFMLPINREKRWLGLGQLALYHLGRLMAYGMLGLAFGAVGKGFHFFGLQQKLSIAVGVLFIAWVLLPRSYLPKWPTKMGYSFLGKLRSRLGQELKKGSPDTFLTIGFLNGFLPCGLVYMALFAALTTGNAWEGGMYMVLFGSGTVPLMTTVVFLRGLVRDQKVKLQKYVPVFVFFMGAFLIIRGLGLGIPYLSPKSINAEIVTAQVECHQPE